MNRRHFLAGSIALAGQQKLLRSMGAMPIGGQGTPAATSPQNLLSTTFTESFLTSNLVSADKFHPYPRWDERAAWEAVPEDLRVPIVQQAEADQKAGWNAVLATTFLEFKRNGNRSRYEAQSFGRHSQLERLVLAECLEGKGRFVDDIVNGVWLICEESFWGASAHLYMQKGGPGLYDITDPIIELFGAETAQLLAWTKYFVGAKLDEVSPLVNKRIVLETERRILEPARNRNDFWWMGFETNTRTARLNNWTPWINSNLLVANLLLEEDPKMRVQETIRITKSLDAYLNQYWPDAGEEEGAGYFSASPMCYFEAVSMIDAATGKSTNILANPFIDAMARYILNAHIAEDSYIDTAMRTCMPDRRAIYSIVTARLFTTNSSRPSARTMRPKEASEAPQPATGAGSEASISQACRGLCLSCSRRPSCGMRRARMCWCATPGIHTSGWSRHASRPTLQTECTLRFWPRTMAAATATTTPAATSFTRMDSR